MFTLFDGISRYALAKKAEVDYAWLRCFEQGKSGIRVEALIQLAKGLGMPASSIMAAIEKALENSEAWLSGYGARRALL